MRLRIGAQRSQAGRGWCRKCGFSRAVSIRGHVGLPGVSDRAFYAAFSVIFWCSASCHRPQPRTPFLALPFLCVGPPRPASPEFRSQFGSGAGPSHFAGHYFLWLGRKRRPSARAVAARPWSSWVGSAGRPSLALPQGHLGGDFGAGRTL